MLKFTYSKEMELKELLWIYSEHDFFVKNKYKVFYPTIPNKISKKLESEYRDLEAQKLLEFEFEKIFKREKPVYDRTIKLVGAQWQKIEADFFKILTEINLNSSVNQVICYISRYGPGGSYYPPKKISVRVVEEFDQDITEVNEKIAHEIVHLAINDLVVKYKLNFDNTERLVDLILVKTPISKLLINPTIQGFGDKRLDDCFQHNYPNIKNALDDFVKLSKIEKK